MHRIVSSLAACLLCGLTFAQSYRIAGTILNKKDGSPVAFATVVLANTEQWAVADENGKFEIKNIPRGKNTISVSCLCFVTDTRDILVERDIPNYTIRLSEDNLSLQGVVVTAKENENSATTSRTIDRNTLNHVQMVGISDIAGLLPGGVTTNPSLTSTQRFNLRAEGLTEAGNASFGTAVEVDGARLSNNASFSETRGVTTNNIASSNVESVEVISGVPSVEYGDVGAGIVKVNTKKGKTPYVVTFTTNPNIKQVSLSKGLTLGQTRKDRSRGVLNLSAEYTNSFTDRRSPYTSYVRRQLSLTYSNLLNSGLFSTTPLRFSLGASGNLGGWNSESDPDLFLGTYENRKDNSFRGNADFNWLLSKPWITSLEFKGSIVYGDRLSKTRSHYSSAAGVVSLHGKEEGYFVAEDYRSDTQPAIMIPRGYWYNIMYLDDKPLTYKLTLKSNWARKFGAVNNKLKLGTDWTGDGNFGRGEYSEDLATAPTYRTYDYSEVPFMDNLAIFAEDNISIPIGRLSHLNLIAGLRGESTFIKGSAYGTTSSFSPRFNAKWSALEEASRRNHFLKSLSLRASWGIAVKQPSFAMLYPRPNYRDIRVFNPPTASDGTAYYAYYIMPTLPLYNSNLVWQRNKQSEVGLDINLGGNRISLAGYWNRTEKSYIQPNSYIEFSYNYTDQKALESCTIPVDNRIYNIDASGVVTVTDKTGALNPETVAGILRRSLIRRDFADNSISPVDRYGLEWIVDFKKINPINTDIRVDGSWYRYKTVNSNMLAYSPATQTMADGSPYIYVGWYYGGNSIANGSESRLLRTNLTLTTHIPKARMILSMKLESTLLHYSRNLSEKADGRRTYAIDDRSSFVPSADPEFMDRRRFTVSYPEYYTAYGDPTRVPFLDKFLWAKDHDPTLYNELSKLVVKSSFTYQFAKDYLDPYFSANFSVTKEIGDIASLSFYANNFFRNIGQLWSTRTQRYVSISSYIPAFYYGMTIRIKF